MGALLSQRFLSTSAVSTANLASIITSFSLNHQDMPVASQHSPVPYISCRFVTCLPLGLIREVNVRCISSQSHVFITCVTV